MSDSKVHVGSIRGSMAPRMRFLMASSYPCYTNSTNLRDFPDLAKWLEQWQA